MKINRLSHLLGLSGIALMLAGCHTDMWRQPKAVAQEPNNFFQDKQADRKPVAGTVPLGGLRNDTLAYGGRNADGKLATAMPATITIEGVKYNTSEDLEKILARGKNRFAIYCSHCHGAVGDGKGMIAQRGLNLRRQPGNYHTDRLRNMPIGHFYDVMTNGFGVMYPMNNKLEPGDRWAVAAYIRVLQRAQNVPAATLPADKVSELDKPVDDGHGMPSGGEPHGEEGSHSEAGGGQRTPTQSGGGAH
jgi:mono/diheme cytochrome c family protein